MALALLTSESGYIDKTNSHIDLDDTASQKIPKDRSAEQEKTDNSHYNGLKKGYSMTIHNLDEVSPLVLNLRSPRLSYPGYETPRVRYNIKDGFDFLRELGEGAYAKAFLAVDKETHQQFCIKITNRERSGPKMESLVMKSLKRHNDNIVKYYDFQADDNYTFLILEYIEGKTLLEHVRDHDCLAERRARFIFRQIIQGIDFLHNNGIIHRDLKLENIMLTTTDKIKIIDFGFACFWDKDIKINTFCGSLHYVSPEIINATPYKGPEIDIWSIGVVLYSMLNGFMPFDSKDDKLIPIKILSGNPKYPTCLSVTVKHLIRSMLEVNAQKRITIPNIMEHFWYKDQKPENALLPRSSSGNKMKKHNTEEIITKRPSQLNIDLPLIGEQDKMPSPHSYKTVNKKKFFGIFK